MALSLITAKAAFALTLAVGPAGAASGCVSRPMPAAQITASETAIRTAEELGAVGIPDASTHLELARDQLTRARRAFDAGDFQTARWLLLRADADAHLALALTREARTEEAAAEVKARVQELSP